MLYLSDMIWVELRKIRRSPVPLFTALGSLVMPFGVALLIYLAKNPAVSQKLGLLGAKANLTAYIATDWQSFLSLTALIVAAGGYFLFVLAISWVFGREFADGTLKDMLAVPVPRASILLAKYITVALWSLALTLFILIFSLAAGALIRLPSGTPAVILQGCALVGSTALLVIITIPPFALFASLGRGYLLPLGLAVLLLIIANMVQVAGWGEYYPWAVPALLAGGKDTLPAASFWIVGVTGLLGMLGTYLWWKLADQNR